MRNNSRNSRLSSTMSRERQIREREGFARSQRNEADETIKPERSRGQIRENRERNRERASSPFGGSRVRPGESVRYTDEELETKSLSESHRDETRERQAIIRHKAVTIILVVLCCYMVTLIFGVAMTDYQYNKDGKIAPAVMSVADIREKAQFSQVKGQYENIRELYKKILLLDYRMAQGQEDQKLLATEYQKYLDSAAGIATKIKALNVDTKYNEIKTMMYNWSYTYMAQYIQYMASAILQDNSSDAEEALKFKDDLLIQFTSITQSLVAVGENINGVDLTDMKKFDPGTYAENKIKGKEK